MTERLTLNDSNAIPTGLPVDGTESAGPRMVLRPLAEVQPRQVRWLVPGLIPLRTLTLVAGVGGLGKSTWLMAIAASVSRGELGEPGDVIIVSFEDPAAEVLRPRAEAAGADLRRLHEVVVEGLDGIDPVRLPRDVGELLRMIGEVQARFVIIDPVVAAIDTAFDAHKDQHVRAVLAQLAAIAEEKMCAIALVGHLNKTPSSDPYIRVASSVAFWNAARSVVLVTEDPDEPESSRLVGQRKANWSRVRPVERHRIEEILLPGTTDPDTGEPVVTSRMTFVELADDVDAADLLAPRANGDGTTKGQRARRFLLAALAGGDWQPSAELKERADREGISEATLKREAKELDIEHESRGFPRETYWRLPQLAQGYTQDDEPTAADAANPHGYAQSELFDSPVGSVGPRGTENDPTDGPCDHADQWRARDGQWRCSSCDPPASPREALETSTLDALLRDEPKRP